nr:helix-turn-helix transcriptional regulator [Burkholderiaceae bacterium]
MSEEVLDQADAQASGQATGSAQPPVDLLGDADESGLAPRVPANGSSQSNEPIDEQRHFGQRLLVARKALGWSQAEMAGRLRLHLRQVVALEEADLSALPEPAFIRGYVRNYARLVGLDELALLEDLKARTSVQGGELAQEPMDKDRAWMVAPAEGSLEWVRRWVMSHRALVWIISAGIVLLAVLGVVVTREGSPGVGSALAPVQEGAQGEQAPVAAVEPVGAPAIGPEDLLVATDGEDVTPAAETAAAAPNLRLFFRERSWAEVVQGDGQV